MKERKFLWAKKSEVHGMYKWLPLKQHLLDTTEVIKLLWEHWLSQIQKQIIIQSLEKKDEELAKQLAGFLASIHDLGKATPVFQAKSSFFSSRDLDLLFIDKLEKAGFKDIQHLNLMNAGKSPHALAGQALLESYGVSSDIGSIIGGHHGKPVDSFETVDYQLTSYAANYFQNEDSQDEVHKKWVVTQREIFNWALDLNGFENAEELPQVKQIGQVILSSLLIMADWIASNEEYFPLLSVDTDIVKNQERRKQIGWTKWIKTYPWQPEEILNVEDAYNLRFGFDPHEIQAKFSKVIQNTDKPGIYILEAPMGGGKTEAALLGVEQLAEKTGVEGMFFGLPTQATSNGIFKRIKDWVNCLSESEKRTIQLVHGKSALNEEYNNLPRATNISDDEEEGVMVNEWFVGRKTAVLDEFVVGTVDQFLMMSLKQKHLMLRHLGFSKKVIVIDEVHAYDAYMNQYLERALRWAGAYGIPIIILSATLPGQTRMKLTEAYMRGQGYKWREVEKLEDWGTTTKYPLITYSDGHDIKQERDFKSSVNKRVIIQSLEEDKLMGTLEERLSEGGVAGVIVNTVRKAQELAEKFEARFGEEQVDLLHSSFIALDRVQKEIQLLAQIGKEANRPYKKIIIGTQVIEQSLDIDFDLLISDLAPMDLLIQRIGRLHRHSLEIRPKKLKRPTTYIMGMDDEFEFDSGSEAIYGSYLLMRTQTLLSEYINLPEDISKLVQTTYSKENLHLPKDLRKDYEKAKTEHVTKIERKKAKAQGFLLNKPDLRGKKSLVGWLESNYIGDSEQKSEAQVRDIEETIEVIALKKMDEGYGFFESFENLSLKINEPLIQQEIAKHTLRLPMLLSAFFRIDQTIEELEIFNRKYLRNWQTSLWLKGELGIIFDEKNEFLLNGFRLHYSPKYGLSYVKEEKNE